MHLVVFIYLFELFFLAVPHDSFRILILYTLFYLSYHTSSWLIHQPLIAGVDKAFRCDNFPAKFA